jgi:uncharacterized protein (DUF2141 family)
MVVLFGSEAAYGGQGAPVAQAMVDVAAGQHTATFTVPAGDYAVKSFHDVNGDGRMNTNPFGMPTEPYAFSNNARGNMGPATWAQAHFTVEGDTPRRSACADRISFWGLTRFALLEPPTPGLPKVSFLPERNP